MKPLGLYLTLLALSGVSCQGNRIDAVETAVDGCPEKPSVELDSSNVQKITLASEAIAISGRVSTHKHEGYSFAATSGQQLQYETEDDLCLWIYTPDNQLVDTTELPVTGNYILQVAAPRGEKSFELAIAFQPEQTPETQAAVSVPSEKTYRFNEADFPKASCGDPKPTDLDKYPIEFYPVNVPYSLANLDSAQIYFCRDSLKKISKDTQEEEVQIASFTSFSKAKAFADFVSGEIYGAQVGSPTVIYE